MTSLPGSAVPWSEAGPPSRRTGRVPRHRQQLHGAASQGNALTRGIPYAVTTLLRLPAPPGGMRPTEGAGNAGGLGRVPGAVARAELGGGATVETKEPEASGPMSVGLPSGRQRRRLTLMGVPGSVAKGRAFTRQALRDWGWDRTETSEDTLLLVSELLTNASLHANGCRELVLTADQSALHIEVHDGTTTPPVRHSAPQHGVPGGRGLYIVERLSDRWGTHTYGTGKAVWAEIEASRLEYGMAAER